MADCDKRIIKSPISGEEVESKTWRHIYEQIGENSIEADRLYEQLLSPEFTTWFGDWVNNSPDASKVVNENGEPLMVYHGSDKAFNTFDKTLSGNKTGKAKELPGFYFFDHPYPAKEYTIDRKGGGRLHSFMRAIEGYEMEQMREMYPDVFEAYNKAPDEEKEYGIEEFAHNFLSKEIKRGEVLPSFLSIRNPLVYDNSGRRIDTTDIASKLKLENDGVEIQRVMDRLNDSIGLEDNVYIALEPNQIKSVFNEGKYSTQKGKYEVSNNYHTEPFIFDGSNYAEFSKRRQELIAKGAKDVELSGNSIRYNADADNIYFQSTAEKLKSSKASDETVSDWKLWFKQTGTDLKILTEDLTDDQGNKLDANESVDVLNRVVKVIQGNENTAIPEAGMHIVARIIKQNYPEMFKEMMKRVDKFSSFPDIVQEYKQFKNYQLPDGKPDMAKIKEEAIGKYLAEFQILDKEGMTEKPELIEQTRTWWQKIKDFLYDFFKGNPFSKTLEKFEKGELDDKSTTYDTITGKQQESSRGDTETAPSYSRTSEGTDSENTSGTTTFYQSAGPDKGKQVFDDIKLRAQDTEHVIDEVAAKEEDKNYYKKKSTGERIKNRVTDRSKKVLRATFGDSERLPEWDEKAKTGIAGHADINDVLERYIDRETGIINRGENGELISTREPMESRINPKEQGYYQMLEKMVTELIKPYPSTTRFVWEEPLYDPDKDEVGSPDLLAIHADGTVDNYDWKFLDIKETTKDIPKYKKQAYNAQMQGYASILRKQYGVEKIGRSRIMPIQAMYAHDGSEFKFAGIKTANSEDFYKGEHREYLLPVPSTEERYTADPRVQSYINNLNSVLGKMEDIAGDLQGKERLSVNEDIKQLTTAIRHLQVKQDVTDSANFAMKEMDNLAKKLQTYKEVFDNSKEGEYTEEDLARISKDLNIARDMITPFEGLEHYFKEPGEVELLTKLTRRVWEARDYIKELESQVLEKGYANPRGVFGVAGEDPTTGKTYADRVITFFQNLFDVHSNASTRAGQLFSKLISEAYNKYIIDADVAEEKHVVIKDSVKEWVKTHSADSLDKLLLKQGKNQFGRVDKYAKDFYTKLKEHLSKKDGKWISENIDTTAYIENYDKEFKNFKEWAHEYATFQTTNKDKQDRIAYELIEQFQKKYDIQLYPKDALTSSNDKLYRFPTEKWYSTEYKELLKPENKPVLDYYNYIQETVDRAKAAGIDIKNPSSFFPMGEKTFVESIAGQNKFQNIIRNLGSTVTLRPGEGGKIDPLTDAPQDKLMVHFIQDISHENNKGERDYTNISRNIFTMMDLFNAQIDKYANFSKIEDVTKLLLHVEKEKKVIETTLSNKVVMKDGQPSLIADSKNYEFLEHLVDVGLYEKDGSYLESGLGFVYDWNKTAEKWNKVLGADVMPLSSDETIYISIPKAVKTLNRRVIFKALGFNPLSAIANLFGGRVQSWIDNRFVSKEDLNLGRNLIAKANFMSEEGQVAGALLKYFTPYTTDELLQKARKDDLSIWNKWLSSQTLMSMLHGSEMHVQSSNALAYMKNLIVRNGKMVHAWEYLKGKYGYDKIYDLPAEKVKEIKDKMNKELKELKENESILKISKVVDGKLVIPGIDNKKDSSVLDARDKMMQMNRDATGSLTATEKMRMDQNFVGNSLMMFKHWIPPLVQTRFGNMTFNAGSNTYRWGRWKMLGAAVSERGLGAVTQLVGHLTGNEQSIVELAKALYKKKRAEIAERGETLQFDHNMSEAEFIDMYRDGMRVNLTDAIAALTLLGAYAAITAAQKENEDEEKAGIYRAMAKISDKLSDELLFFYSPVTFMELTGGSHSALIPAMGIFTDTEKFLRSSAKEIYFDATGDEESAEKNKLAKFPISYTPGINKITEWYAMFDDDFSVELKGRKAPNK